MLFEQGSAWCPFNNTDGNRPHWVIISNTKQQIWQGIQLQARADEEMYVTALKISYSDNGQDWTDIEPSQRYSAPNKPYVFKGLNFQNSTDFEQNKNKTLEIWFEGLSTTYPFVVRSRQLRISPVEWKTWPCMRLEAYYYTS